MGTRTPSSASIDDKTLKLAATSSQQQFAGPTEEAENIFTSQGKRLPRRISDAGGKSFEVRYSIESFS